MPTDTDTANVLSENETETTASTELTDERIDELVRSTEKASNSTIPMTAKDAPQSKEAKAAEKFMEFTHNGKPIKATVDQVIKWAQQGYDYPQKMGEFNKLKSTFENERKTFADQIKAAEAKFSPYMQIDQWASQHPDKWQALTAAWQQNVNGQTQPQAQTQDPYAPKLNQLETKLSQFEQFAQSVMQERQAEANKQEDLKLDQEIQSIREAHKDLDWDTLDQDGKSLEFKVLEHAQKQGISSFKTAFRDFYHDELMSMAQAKAKIDVSKGIQRNAKLGLLGQSQGPSRKQGFSEARDPKKQSYEELAREALAELRASAS